MAKIRIGMSGWTYPGWRGPFYPKGLVQKKELEYASRQVNSIEINGTFYGLQKPKSFQAWHDQTPDDFVFSIKGGQFLTHVLRLKGDVMNEALSNFFASGLLALGPKLGPILWQFPPFMKLKDDRFEKFLKMLPHDQKSMAKIAKKHTEKLDGRSFTKALGDYPVRHAFEFRHPSFKDPQFLSLMKKHNAAVVFAHSGKSTAPYMEDLTSDFVYLRMHGMEKKYAKGYKAKDIDTWASRVKLWSQGKQPKDADVTMKQKPKAVKRDVFLYFDNDEKVHAPKNAVELLKKLKIKLR